MENTTTGNTNGISNGTLIATIGNLLPPSLKLLEVSPFDRPNQVEGYSKVKQGIEEVAATQSHAVGNDREMYSQPGKENFASGNTLTFNRFV